MKKKDEKKDEKKMKKRKGKGSYSRQAAPLGKGRDKVRRVYRRSGSVRRSAPFGRLNRRFPYLKSNISPFFSVGNSFEP